MSSDKVKSFKAFTKVEDGTLLMSAVMGLYYLCEKENREESNKLIDCDTMNSLVYPDGMSFGDRLVSLSAYWSNDLHYLVKEELESVCPDSPLLEMKNIWSVIYKWLDDYSREECES